MINPTTEILEVTGPSMLYGFLDPQTNVFYAFDSAEEYQRFLDMAAMMSQETG